MVLTRFMQAHDFLNALTGSVSNDSLTAWETDNSLFISIDVPGIKKEDISITIENGILRIEAPAVAEKDVKYLIKPIRSKLDREIKIPPEFLGETDGMNAEYESGILTVSIPKGLRRISRITVK